MKNVNDLNTESLAGEWLKKAHGASFLSAFYIPARYPADTPDFTWEDGEKAFESAQRVKEAVYHKLGTM